MMPWKTWLVRLGVAGALVMVAGCGSSDVPDPGSDSAAAELPSAEGPVQVAAPAAAPAAEPQVAAEEGAAKPEEAKPEEAQAEAPSTPAGSNASPDKNSATAEMLAMATKGQPGGNGEAAPNGGSGPGAGQGPPGGGGGGGMAEMQRRMQQSGGGGAGGPGMGMMGPGAPGAGGPNPSDMAKMQSSMQNQMAQQQRQNQMQGPGAGRGAGMPGGARGPGGSNDKEPDFHDPRKAVDAFLNALKDKDLDALTEATAIHAQIEASSNKNRGIFKRIYDGSLSEAELDDISNKLDGFKVSSENPPKSTGKIQVIVQKTDKERNNARVTRVITVRHEKGGWKVCDVSGESVFLNPYRPKNKATPFKDANKQ